MERDEEALLEQLLAIDEYEFEQFVADLWARRGWDTTVTTGSNDAGIDVIAEQTAPFQQKQLIQAKRYAPGNNVGSPDIQQYSSLRQQVDGVDAVIVVTTSDFTRQARAAAADLNVKLVDYGDLYEMVADLDDRTILEEYLDISPSTDDGATDRGSPHPGIREFQQNGALSSLDAFLTHLQHSSHAAAKSAIGDVFDILGYEDASPERDGDFFEFVMTKPDVEAAIKIYCNEELTGEDVRRLNERWNDCSATECLVFLLNATISKAAQQTGIDEGVTIYENGDCYNMVRNALDRLPDDRADSPRERDVDAGASAPDHDELVRKIEALRSDSGSGSFMNVVFDENEKLLQLAPTSVFNVSTTAGATASIETITDRYDLPVLDEMGESVVLGYWNEEIESREMAEITAAILSEVYDVELADVRALTIVD